MRYFLCECDAEEWLVKQASKRRKLNSGAALMLYERRSTVLQKNLNTSNKVTQDDETKESKTNRKVPDVHIVQHTTSNDLPVLNRNDCSYKNDLSAIKTQVPIVNDIVIKDRINTEDFPTSDAETLMVIDDGFANHQPNTNTELPASTENNYSTHEPISGTQKPALIKDTITKTSSEIPLLNKNSTPAISTQTPVQNNTDISQGQYITSTKPLPRNRGNIHGNDAVPIDPHKSDSIPITMNTNCDENVDIKDDKMANVSIYAANNEHNLTSSSDIISAPTTAKEYRENIKEIPSNNGVSSNNVETNTDSEVNKSKTGLQTAQTIQQFHENLTQKGIHINNSFKPILADDAKKRTDFLHASVCMIFAKQNSKSHSALGDHFQAPPFVVSMQVRADGYLGFHGGVLNENETWEEGMMRELREEVGPIVDQFPIFPTDYVYSVISTADSKQQIIVHFYIKQIPYKTFCEMEIGMFHAEHFASEVFGPFRCPLMLCSSNDDDKRGLPTFLGNLFIGNCVEQLLFGLWHANILSIEEITRAIRMAGIL